MATIEDFFDESAPAWGTPVEQERKRRIRLSVAAYSYELLDVSIMPDAEFDALCNQIIPSMKTDNKIMDKFFKEIFDKSTGQWIHKHPQLDGIKRLYHLYYEDKNA